MTITSTCTCTLVTGKRKGQACGRLAIYKVRTNTNTYAPVCKMHRKCSNIALPDGKNYCMLLNSAFDGLSRLNKPRSYYVDIDGGPTKWNAMLRDFRTVMVMTVEYLKDQLGTSKIRSILRAMAAMFNYAKLVTYHDEMKEIAKAVNMELGDIMLLNFTYEGSAHCTSVVTTATTGHAIHGRTLDWDATFLKKLTCRIVMCRDGNPVYETSTWAGFVGVFTGVRRGVFSISVNYRDTGNSMIWNLLQVVTGAWSIGMLIRHMMEDTSLVNAEHITELLSTTRLIAPVYFTVAFLDSGVILTRDRNSLIAADQLTLSTNPVGAEWIKYPGKGKKWHLSHNNSMIVRPISQANLDRSINDPMKDFTDSLNRQTAAEKVGVLIMPHDLARALNSSPIRHATTIYETIMYPAACEGEDALVMRTAK